MPFLTEMDAMTDDKIYPDICNCCLEECENNENNEEYFYMIVDCFSDEILHNKTLSSRFLICNPCIGRLQECTQFKNKIIDSQSKLYNILIDSANECNGSEENNATAIGDCSISIKSEDSIDLEFTTKKTIIKNENKKYRKSRDRHNDYLENKRKQLKANVKIPTSSNAFDIKGDIEQNFRVNLIFKHEEEDSKLVLIEERCNVIQVDNNTKCTSSNNQSNSNSFSNTDSNIEDTGAYVVRKNSKMKKKSVKNEMSKCKKDAMIKKIGSTHVKPFKIKKTDVICPICNKNMVSNICLATHMNEHYQRFICHICGKGFVMAAAYREHLKGHNKDQVCKLCNKTFTKKALRVHMKMVHLGQNDAHPCSICDARFRSSYSRATHLEKVHKINEKHTCETCGKTFSVGEKYKRHLYTHYSHKKLTEDISYSCHVCNKVFPTESRLKAHGITHKSIRDFQCHLCPKSFKVKYMLTRHLKMHDDNSEKYVCTVCNAKFAVKHILKRHFKRVHKMNVDLNSLFLTDPSEIV